MPKMDLKTPIWDENKRLYRPGKGVDIPQALYNKLNPGSGGEGGAKQEATYPMADLLAEAGYGTWEDVKAASDEDLLEIDGIGPASLSKIRAHKG